MASKVVLVKGSSGLGNRIEVVVGAMLYARLTHRELIVDWSDSLYSDDTSNVFHRLFRCPAVFVCDDLAKLGESISPELWRGRLKRSRQQMSGRLGLKSTEELSALSIDLRRLDYDAQVLVLTGTHDRINLLKEYHPGLLPDLDRLDRSQLIAKTLAEQLVPTDDVRSRIDNFKAQHFAGRTVGIHIRYSDYRANLLGLLRRLNALLDRERDLQVFVATDNEAVLQVMRRHYPRVITTSHWFDPRGAALHKSKLNCARAEGAIAALIDLYLLGECDYLVLDLGSSFSYLASVLSKAAPDRILVVRSGGKGPGMFGDRITRPARRLINRIMLNMGALSWGLRALGALVPIRKL